MTIFLGKGGGEKKFTSSRGGDNFFFTLGEGGGRKKFDAFSEKFCRPPPHLINERSLICIKKIWYLKHDFVKKI